jgi:hypothetical protein
MNYNFYAYFDQVELYKRSKTFREDKFFKISQNVKIPRSSVIMCSFCAFYMGKYCADASVTEFIDPVFENWVYKFGHRNLSEGETQKFS